jgi:hypothetical protein
MPPAPPCLPPSVLPPWRRPAPRCRSRRCQPAGRTRSVPSRRWSLHPALRWWHDPAPPPARHTAPDPADHRNVRMPLAGAGRTCRVRRRSRLTVRRSRGRSGLPGGDRDCADRDRLDAEGQRDGEGDRDPDPTGRGRDGDRRGATGWKRRAGGRCGSALITADRRFSGCLASCPLREDLVARQSEHGNHCHRDRHQQWDGGRQLDRGRPGTGAGSGSACHRAGSRRRRHGVSRSRTASGHGPGHRRAARRWRRCAPRPGQGRRWWRRRQLSNLDRNSALLIHNASPIVTVNFDHLSCHTATTHIYSSTSRNI